MQFAVTDQDLTPDLASVLVFTAYPAARSTYDHDRAVRIAQELRSGQPNVAFLDADRPVVDHRGILTNGVTTLVAVIMAGFTVTVEMRRITPPRPDRPLTVVPSGAATPKPVPLWAAAL